MPDLKTTQETLRSPVDGTELVRLATSGANWQAPLSTIFTSTPGPWTMSKGPLTLNLTTGSSTQGIALTQSGSLTDTNSGNVTGTNGEGFAYNTLFINQDARADFGTSPYSRGLSVWMNTGGANARGSKIAFASTVYRTAPDNTAQAYGDTIAGNFLAESNIGDGGTGVTLGTARGTLFGLGVGAVAGPGSTNLFIVSGAEVDVGINTGASSYGRLGWSIVGTGQVQAASIYDVALEISASGKEWKTGIMFSSLHGTTPVSTTGTLIGTDANAQTVANGIDFSQYTITNNFLKSSKFSVAGTGTVSINPTASSTNAGFTILQTLPTSGSLGGAIYPNSITIGADALDANGNLPTALFINYTWGGANAKGGRIGIGAQSFLNTASALAASDGPLGATFGGFASVNAGGTNTGAGAGGTVVGANIIAQLNSGATNFLSVNGLEVDTQSLTGASVKNRWGIASVSIGAGNAGVTNDTAFAIWAQTGAAPFKFGYLLSNNGGGTPLATTGTVFGSDGTAWTVANGIDLSTLTITGSFLKGPSFTVDGSGNIANGTTSASTWFLPGAATTAKSIMRLPVGGPPSSPLDGDVWREDNTNTGVKIRINGVTKTFTVS